MAHSQGKKWTEIIREEAQTLYLLDKDFNCLKIQEVYIQVLVLSLIHYISWASHLHFLDLCLLRIYTIRRSGWSVVTSWDLENQFSPQTCSVCPSQYFFFKKVNYWSTLKVWRFLHKIQFLAFLEKKKKNRKSQPTGFSSFLHPTPPIRTIKITFFHFKFHTDFQLDTYPHLP